MDISHRAFKHINPSGATMTSATWKGCGKELNRILGKPRFKWYVNTVIDKRTGKVSRETVFKEI